MSLFVNNCLRTTREPIEFSYIFLSRGCDSGDREEVYLSIGIVTVASSTPLKMIENIGTLIIRVVKSKEEILELVGEID